MEHEFDQTQKITISDVILDANSISRAEASLESASEIPERCRVFHYTRGRFSRQPCFKGNSSTIPLVKNV